MSINVLESLIFTVEGELDIATAPQLSERLARAGASDAEMVLIDLDRVSFMDSAGLHVLVNHAATSRHNGQSLRLTQGLSEQVRRIFEITGAQDELPFLTHWQR